MTRASTRGATTESEFVPDPEVCLSSPGDGSARARRPGLLTVHWRFFAAALVALTLSRVALLLWQSDRAGTAGEFLVVLRNGLRIDVLTLCYAVAPALLLSLVFGGRHLVGRGVGRLVALYLTAIATALVFMEVATPSFIAEYDSRPNRLFIEYLVYPEEVTSMLLGGYKVAVAVATLVTLFGAALAWRGLRRVAVPERGAGPVKRLLLLGTLGPLVFLGARSSLQHRPANPSSVVFSDDHLLNDLCLNSAYSVAYAASQMRGEADAAEVYGALPDGADAAEILRHCMSTVRPDQFIDGACPTLHRQDASVERARPKNLVIILEESLGAQYVGALGGRPVTRFLDTLSERGWWFDEMYATGTRSVRGIEAVASGFLPTPGRSVVKLGLSQTRFFTLASYLRDRGYRTQFVYGGESHFDNMKSFFSGNGFQEIVDRADFAAPTFEGSWGVCDEDILMKAHESYLAAGDQPFFSLVFSVSNHSPWDYPSGVIEPYNAPAETVENTVRYADHALERFFDAAEEAPYWDDTLFVVVADHDSRVHGASLVPVEHFHIPAVIVGPGVEPRRDPRIASQIDLPPTLLSLMGVSGTHPMVGNDLTALPESSPGRAIMQYGSNMGYREGDDLVVLRPHLPPLQFLMEGGDLTEARVDAGLHGRALAHALVPSKLYRERTYTAAPPPTIQRNNTESHTRLMMNNNGVPHAEAGSTAAEARSGVVGQSED